MEKVFEEARGIVLLVLKISLIPILGLILAGNWAGLRGFGLGLGVNIITFMMLTRSAWQITGIENKTRAQVISVVNYLVRFSFYGITLIVAFMQPDINPIAAVIGLLMVKYVLIGKGFLGNFSRLKARKIGSVEE